MPMPMTLPGPAAVQAAEPAITESDALGNLAIVRSWTRPWQAGDTPYAEIKLRHDLLGNLTRVEQPGGIVATMHYASRYYGPSIGSFISPDPTSISDRANAISSSVRGHYMLC